MPSRASTWQVCIYVCLHLNVHAWWGGLSACVWCVYAGRIERTCEVASAYGSRVLLRTLLAIQNSCVACAVVEKSQECQCGGVLLCVLCCVRVLY